MFWYWKCRLLLLIFSDKCKSKKKLSVKETLLQKKTIKAALSPCGCGNDCTRNEFLTPSFIKKQRKNLWRRRRIERDQWLLDNLDEFSLAGKKVSHFHLSGRLCKNAWLQIFGINKNTYYRVLKSKVQKALKLIYKLNEQFQNCTNCVNECQKVWF